MWHRHQSTDASRTRQERWTSGTQTSDSPALPRDACGPRKSGPKTAHLTATQKERQERNQRTEETEHKGNRCEKLLSMYSCTTYPFYRLASCGRFSGKRRRRSRRPILGFFPRHGDRRQRMRHSSHESPTTLCRSADTGATHGLSLVGGRRAWEAREADGDQLQPPRRGVDWRGALGSVGHASHIGPVVALKPLSTNREGT